MLAAVSINAAFNSKIMDTAVDGTIDYIIAQGKEEELFNDLDEYIRVITNKKAVFDYIEVNTITATTASIKVRATDSDGDNLTYILYMGTSEDNLEEKDRIENVEQGIEVELHGTEINTEILCYYRIDVLDKYAITQSQVSTLQNKKPVITKAEVTDITRTTAKAVIQGTDEDADDKLTYRVLYRR